MTPSKRRPAAAPAPAPKRRNPFDEKSMSPKDVEYFREQKRQEDQRKKATEQYDKFGNPFEYAKGGMTGLRKAFAGKETPAEERKEKVAAKKAGMSYAAAERRFEPGKHKSPAKAPAKAGMKRMMGGGSCK